MTNVVEVGAFVGRTQEIELLLDALADGPGAYLVGASGVGKSALANAAAARCRAERGWHVVHLRATTGSAELPFGLFGGLLKARPTHGAPLFAEVRETLQELADGAPLLIVVDDVDLLDDASAVLLHQMVSLGESRLLATLRAGRMAPHEVLDMAQRGELRRITIGALDQNGCAAMAGSLLGRPLAVESSARLLEATGGNALLVREVVLAVADSNAIEVRDDTIVLAGLPTAAPRLVEVINARVASLPERHRTALQHLAFAEPCGPAELASVASLDDLGELEQIGLIATSMDRERLIVRMAHPLYGEVLRSSTSHLRRRLVLGTLAKDLEATGVRRRGDRLKLARMAVDGGVEIDPAVLTRGAATAFHNEDFVLADRLSRRAFEMAGSFEAGWEVAGPLMFVGSADAMREHLDQWAHTAVTVRQRRAVAMVAGTAEAWAGAGLGRCMEIVQPVLDEGEADDETGTGIDRGELAAAISFMQTTLGDVNTALGMAEPFVGRDGQTGIRAGLGAGAAFMLGGRPIDAAATCQRATEEFGRLVNDDIALPVAYLEVMSMMSALVGGEMQRARRIRDRAIQHTSGEFHLAMANLYGASIERFSGRLVEARRMIETAANWALRRESSRVAQRIGTALYAVTAATQGDFDTVELILDVFDSSDCEPTCYDFEAHCARVRLLAHRGLLTDAVDSAIAAAQACEVKGQLYPAAMCWYELVRLHRPELAAAAYDRFGGDLQGEMFAALVAHAHAMSADDHQALGDAADAFETLGMLLHASEAAVHASDAARRAGDQRRGAFWNTRAAEWRAQCDVTVMASAPSSVIIDSGPIALTRREREIGMLAAQGLSSREIGERLYISRRTAENHLGNVYVKLGVSSRVELARLLDGGVAALAG